jgi:4-amino-4-deoxy-L-arabinose transferase-like glycosyltransferase
MTRTPQSDEGHFASAAAAFARQGKLVMPMWTEWIPTLDQRLYANMPLYFVALGGWYKAFGVSFLGMRLFSILWGIVLVVAWSGVVARVSGRPSGAILGAIHVGHDYDINNLTTARYDVMCAALSALALLAYLTLRERRLPAAAAASATLLAASCLVHPYGIFGIMIVGVFALTLDGRRLLDRRVVLAAVAPVAVALGAWGLYIARDPAMFRAQLAAHASGRFATYRTPVAAIVGEVRDRYLTLYGGLRPGVPLAMRFKLGMLALYVGGIAGCVLLPALRRRAEVRALAVATPTAFLMLAYLESNRWYIYFIHVLPLYAACTAVTATAVLDRGRVMRRMVWVGAALAGLFAATTVAYRARQDVQGHAFNPALVYLQRHVASGDLVMAGGEFGVGLGFAEHVLDDPLLGYHNHRVPTWIVESYDYEQTQRDAAVARPEIGAHLRKTLASYQQVFSAERGGRAYRVLRRQTLPVM